VCGPAASQEAFFDASGVRHLIDRALDGVNGSVFAYGQTGSGKTFSMSGVEERLVQHHPGAGGGGRGGMDAAAGVIPRAVRYM
jgi:kinesin family member 12